MCTLEALVVDAVDEDDASEPPELDEPQAASAMASAAAPVQTTALRYEDLSITNS
jgi:hypothetical protein